LEICTSSIEKAKEEDIKKRLRKREKIKFFMEFKFYLIRKDLKLKGKFEG
jgi:hypothetical protein